MPNTEMLEEYKAKFTVDKEVILDPLTLKSGRSKENDNGLCKWLLYFHDITDFLKQRTTPELLRHLINEKKGKKSISLL